MDDDAAMEMVETLLDLGVYSVFEEKKGTFGILDNNGNLSSGNYDSEYSAKRHLFAVVC